LCSGAGVNLTARMSIVVHMTKSMVLYSFIESDKAVTETAAEKHETNYFSTLPSYGYSGGQKVM